MIQISRRCFCLLSASFFSCARASEHSEILPTCVPFFDATNGTPSLKIDYSTISPIGSVRDDPNGDYDYENSLTMVLHEMADFLGLNFAFGYYADETIPNAAFDEKAPLKPLRPDLPSDGAILLGKQLLVETKKLAQNFGPAITAVCAHECGHALQRKYKLRSVFKPSDDDPFAQVRYELCADFVCGYYGAFREERDPSYPAYIQAITQFRKGDEAFVPTGHGTPEQRAGAVESGYSLCKQMPADGKAAVMSGVDYVMGLKF